MGRERTEPGLAVTTRRALDGRFTRRAGAVVVLLSAVAVAGITLFPQGGTDPGALTRCLICGSRGAADALLNILLFVPLGVGLRLSGLSPLRAAGVLVAASALIETLQFAVPGRDPNAGDLLFNTVGGVAGALGARSDMLWPRAKRRAARRSLWAAVAAVSVFLATGILLQPVFPSAAYFGQWTPRLGHLAPYGGRVLAASVGSVPLPPGRLADGEGIRRELLGSAMLRVMAIAGDRTERLASVFSIYDEAQREVVLLGADRRDLVLRYALRASRVRLDRPDVRLHDVMAGVTAGDSLWLAVQLRERGACLSLNESTVCGLGFSIEDGWGLLLYPERAPVWFQAALGIGWIAAFVMPFGLWARRHWASMLGGAVLSAGILAGPPATGLLSAGPLVYAGVVLGLGAGWGLHRVAAGCGLSSSIAAAARISTPRHL